MLQRKAVTDCAEIAGFEILALINEPTAAAIYCGTYENMENGERKTIVAVDLGGGTLISQSWNWRFKLIRNKF